MSNYNHLERITISNARRFGKDILIELDPVANIIIAPNGTGKTTVFEAIEFALTGSIERLVSPPLSLIRDKEESMKVRLDFDKGRFCQVDYQKDSNPVLTGNHSDLFPKHNINEITRILRLTHLLEQRGSNWFVQQNNAEKAGSILDSLSIGRDLTIITKTKTSVTGAATKALSESNNNLKEASDEIESFKNLQKERDSEAKDIKLKPLVDLEAEIIEIYFVITNKKEEIEIKVSAISTFIAQTKSVLTASLRDISIELIQLSGFESKIPVYLENEKQLVTKSKLLEEKNGKVEASNTKITELRKSIQEKTQEVSLKKNELNQFVELKNTVEQQKLAIQNRKTFETSLLTYITQLNTLEENYKIGNDEFTRANDAISKNKGLLQREEEIQNEFGRIKSLENLLIDWQNNLNVILDIENNTLPTLIINENDSKRLMEGAEITLKDADDNFNKSLSKVNSLRNISNEIQAAVGIIAANIPKDQKDCPVCGAEYESDELQRRISNAISSIDPLLTSEIETNSILNGVLNKCKEQLDSAKSALSEIQNKISEAKNSIRINNININEAILPKFKESGNFADSKLWIDNKLKSVNKELEGIKIQKNDLGLIPSSETVFEISTRQEKLAREIDVTKKQKQDVELKLNLIKSELEKLNLKLKDFNEETNENSITTIEGNVEEIQSLIDKDNRLLEAEENLLSNENKDISKENVSVLQITSQQSEILTEWKSISKNDEPNNVVLEERKKALNEKEARFKTYDDKLNDLNEEIAKWKQAEKYTLLNDRIKVICENLNEEQYLESLQAKFREIQSDNLNIVERRKALLDLYNKISSETESVYNYFNSVNPLWTSLLKRIVANPRFAETALSTYPYRNKPHAAVEIKLHGGKVNVMDVASEAQLTDLQLTFLLSMASTYSWTPWKALLLDDPTQHHDLVHAANVFDLLRDYIVDQNFQIILGTHDTVQARFFQRKLQNDGISVKVWNLTANESGVTALLV